MFKINNKVKIIVNCKHMESDIQSDITKHRESGLRYWVKVLAMRIRSILFQNPLGVWPGIGTQPRYEASNVPQVESRIKCSD